MAKGSVTASDKYILAAREEIAAWESGKRGYLARLGDLAFDTPAKLGATLVPQAVQRSACQVIEKTLRLTAHAGKFSIDVENITRQRNRKLGNKKALGSRLKACDELARKFWNTHSGYAAAEGAATGLLGFAGFIADIPLILSIAIRSIRTVALCYGYSTAHPPETDYALHILRIGSSSKKEIKAQTLAMLRDMEKSVIFKAPPAKKRGAPAKRSLEPQYFTLEEYAKSLAIELVQRRALRLVPIAGMVTAVSFNATYAHDIGRTAFMCYRRRFIEENAVFSPVKTRAV